MRHTRTNHGWLDTLAVGMSLLCAVHCLLTPVLLVFLPILGGTFWVSNNFHLWMLLLVLPATSIAVFLGCRKHKDKWVLGLGIAGLLTLVVVSIGEWGAYSSASSDCMHCIQQGSSLSIFAYASVLGGVLLISGHTRNYLLCRSHRCVSCSSTMNSC